MAVSRPRKEEILVQLQELMKESQAMYFVQNTALSVLQSRELRGRLRENGSRFITAKKTLIRKAMADEYNVDINADDLPGSVSICFAMEDPLTPAKTLDKFRKETNKIDILAAYFESEYMTKDDANALAKIPSREELLAKMMGSMTAPLSNFVGLGNNLVAGFARQLQQLSKQKEG